MGNGKEGAEWTPGNDRALLTMVSLQRLSLEHLDIFNGTASQMTLLWTALSSLPKLTWLTVALSRNSRDERKTFFQSVSRMTQLR